MPATAHTWHQHHHVSLLTRTVLAVVIIGFLYWAQAVLIPFALAIFFAFVLTPVVMALQRRGLGRVPATLIVFVLATAVMLGFGALVVTQFVGLVEAVGKYEANIRHKIEALQEMTDEAGWEKLDKFGRDLTGAKTTLDTPPAPSGKGPQPIPVIIEQTEPAWMRWLPGYFDSFTKLLSQAALVMVLTVFMLLAREDLRNRLIRLIGRGRLSLTTRAVDDASHRISRFLLTQLALNIVFGIVVAVGLWLLQVEGAIFWGCLAAALRYVPYIGGPLACLFPTVLSIAQFPGWLVPGLVLVFLIGLEILTSNVFEPLLFGHNTGVSAIALLTSAAFWAFLWGPVGLVLSCPLTVCLVVLGRHVPSLEFLAILLGDEPALEADVVFYQRLAARDPEEAMRIVEQTTKGHGTEAVYDDLLIPALTYVGQDVQRAGMDAEETAQVHQALSEVLNKLGQAREIEQQSAPKPQADGRPLVRNELRIVGNPVRGRSDELALMMLGQLLDPQKWDLEITGSDVLSSELLQRIADEQPAVVCLAAVPPGGMTRSRYLCKRLRKRFPTLKIVVGRWGLHKGIEHERDALRAAGADVVEASLKATLAQLAAWLPPLAEQNEAPAAEQWHAACETNSLATDESPNGNGRRLTMADVKDKVKDTIDTAANKSKEAASKTIDKGKEVASQAGDKMKQAGEKVKQAGK